jgi:hypothetical protein
MAQEASRGGGIKLNYKIEQNKNFVQFEGGKKPVLTDFSPQAAFCAMLKLYERLS